MRVARVRRTRASATRRTWSTWATARPRWSTRPASRPATNSSPTGSGCELAWTLDTHSHADYVTGSPALAARTGAVFVAPAASRLATPHRPVADGDTVDAGRHGRAGGDGDAGPHPGPPRLRPARRDGRPVALFSGGSLMVGTVGRTDLCGADQTEPLARQMFHSLRRFDDLPDDLAVYPTHGAGSFCSAPGASRAHHHARPGAGYQPAVQRSPTRTSSSSGCSPGSAPSPPTSPGSPS